MTPARPESTTLSHRDPSRSESSDAVTSISPRFDLALASVFFNIVGRFSSSVSQRPSSCVAAYLCSLEVFLR
jgi:hypothetical protein